MSETNISQCSDCKHSVDIHSSTGCQVIHPGMKYSFPCGCTKTFSINKFDEIVEKANVFLKENNYRTVVYSPHGIEAIYYDRSEKKETRSFMMHLLIDSVRLGFKNTYPIDINEVL